MFRMASPTTIMDIKQAAIRLQPHIHMTPVMTSSYIDRLADRHVYFKCEHLQKTGSFKVRGATNKILRLQEEMSDIEGVVTHSSGNHGQAVAWAAHKLGLKASIVVPNNTPLVKTQAIKGYGADLVFCKPTPTSRAETAEQIAKEKCYQVVHPYDDYDIIAGQGTIGLELLSQVPQLDAVLISTSGGGLSSGIATAIKAIKPSVKVYCVEPEGKQLGESLNAGKRLWVGEPQFLHTLAEGIRVQQPGQRNFPILTNLVEKTVLSMKDGEMIDGTKLCFERLKQVIELSAGAAVQAVLKYKDSLPHDIQHVGVILCGGNIDINSLPWMAK